MKQKTKVNPILLSWQLIKLSPVLLLLYIVEFLFLLTPIGVSLLIREVFNSLEGLPAFANIWLLIGLIPIMYVFQIFFEICQNHIWILYTYPTRIILRKNILEELYSKPALEALPHSTGEAVSRFRGDVNAAIAFAIVVVYRLAYFSFAVISIVLMASINRMVTLYAFIPFVALLGVMFFLRTKVQEYREQRRRATGKVTSVINEIFKSIQAIKVNIAEANVQENFEKINTERKKKVLKDEMLNSAMLGIRYMTVRIAIGIVLLVVGQLMTTGGFSIGDFTFFYTIFAWFGWFVYILADFTPVYFRTKVSWQRIFEMIEGDTKKDLKNVLIKKQPTYLKQIYPQMNRKQIASSMKLKNINIEKLTCKYSKNGKGIENISFSIPRGSLTVITGRIGAGKTTLLRTFLGLLEKQEGKITWNEKEIKNLTDFFAPPHSAYTPQIPALFSESIKDNILSGLPEQSAQIEKSLYLAVFEKDTQTLEEGLETKVGPKGVKLSGGQKQRLAAARMFVREPELLVFDDLSSALDVETESKMWKRLFEQERMTCIAVSHRPIVLEKADQILVLKEGKLLAKGKLKTLLGECEEMQWLWERSIEEQKQK